MPVSSLISADVGIRVILYAGLACSVFAFGWAKGSQNVTRKWDAEKQAVQAQVIKRQDKVIHTDRVTYEVEEKTDAKTLTALRQLSAERDSLAAALGGMRQHRDYLSSVASSEASTRSFLAENLAYTANSLSECSQRYSEVAQAHDALSVQVTGLLEIDARNLALSKNDE